MARINIEDSLFKDGRFIDLAIKMGSRHAALGAVFEAFMIAQEFFLNNDTNRLIPLSEWKKRKACDGVIEVGLAEIREGDLIYVSGSNEQFGWLIQRQEAGQKGGRPKAPKSGETGTFSGESGSKPEPSKKKGSESGSNPPSLTLTPKKEDITKTCSSVVVGEPEKTATEKQIEKELEEIFGLMDSDKGEAVPAELKFGEVHPALAKNKRVAEVLSKISPELQNAWISRFEISWLKSELQKAIDFHLGKSKAANLAEISDWGRRLAGWFNRAKKPSLAKAMKNEVDFFRDLKLENAPDFGTEENSGGGEP